jgi:hypothetical protein
MFFLFFGGFERKKDDFSFLRELKNDFFNFDYHYNDICDRQFFSNIFDQNFIDKIFILEKELHLQNYDGIFGNFWSIYGFGLLNYSRKFKFNVGEVLVFSSCRKLKRNTDYDEYVKLLRRRYFEA